MTTITLADFDTAAPWIAELLTRAAEERDLVAAFTDEELVALLGVREEQIAPLIWLDQQPRERHEFAASVALRGLVARGLVQQLEDHQEPGRLVLSIPDEVLAVLAMRRTASSILIAERQTNAGKHARVIYQQGELGVLEENINRGGLHTFSVCPERLALEDLAAMCDQDAVAGADEGIDPEEQQIRLADFAQGGEIPVALDKALAVTVIAAVTEPTVPGSEPGQDRLTVYAFADHVKVLHRSAESRDRLVIRRVGRDGLRTAVGSLIGPTV
jgi:hypothetical protein